MPKQLNKGSEVHYHPHAGQKRHEKQHDDQTCPKKPAIDFVSPPITDHHTQSNTSNYANFNYYKSAIFVVYMYMYDRSNIYSTITLRKEKQQNCGNGSWMRNVTSHFCQFHKSAVSPFPVT